MMRLWLSKNSAASRREQLGTQLTLGVTSGNLKPGDPIRGRGRGILSAMNNTRRFANLKAPVTLLVAFALLAQTTGVAAPRPLELKWNELSSAIGRRTIRLTLPDGATISGEVVVVREESLVVNVRKTSDSKAYPKGNATVPRASVTVLSMTESGGRWGRKVGASLGTLAGMLAGGYIAAKTAPNAGAGLAIFGVITGAGMIGGYFVGRSADAKATLIRVVP